MARVRHAAFALQGPARLVWLLHVRRRRRAPPPPSPSPSPSPSSSPVPSPSPSPSPAPAASPSPVPAEATPNASPALIPPHSSSETTSNALTPPHSSSETAPTASLPMTPPRATTKRKADDSLLLEFESGGDQKKMRNPGAPAVWKMVTLEEILALPPSATRPFYPRALERGTRSLKEPRPWKCSKCGNVNDLTRHLIFDLPAFRCRSCNTEPREGESDFGFCYGDLAMNGACPIGHVKTQKPGECIPNTLASCVEITHRIMSTILEYPLSKEGPRIDIADLILKYKKRWQQEGNEQLDGYSGLSLLTMIKVFQIDGVKEKKTSGLPTMTNNELYKVSDWAWVDQNDFAAMSSAIADGYPLICLYKRGPRLVNLKPGDIYVPPLDGALGGHASLLVGAHQEGGVKFLYFLTCNSERFCQRNVSEGDGIRGGIGAIIHGRFDFNPVQIFRFNERETQALQQQ